MCHLGEVVQRLRTYACADGAVASSYICSPWSVSSMISAGLQISAGRFNYPCTSVQAHI